MRGAWLASFFLLFLMMFVVFGSKADVDIEFAPSPRQVSNCISFVATARDVVTCEHVIKRFFFIIGFFSQKHLRFTPTYSNGVGGKVSTENTDNEVPTTHKVVVM